MHKMNRVRCAFCTATIDGYAPFSSCDSKVDHMRLSVNYFIGSLVSLGESVDVIEGREVETRCISL